MFTGDDYSGIMYRGISLASDHLAALDDPCHMVPENLLNEIDARDILDFDIDHFLFLLPNAKSIISSKCEYSYIRVADVDENGVLLDISIHTESGWDELLSPDPIFLELETEFEKHNNFNLHLLRIDHESPIYALNYHLLVPSYNLKEAYERANSLLIDIEKRVYKKILKKIIDEAIDIL